MSFEKHILKVLESFYLITNIPIQYLKYDSEENFLNYGIEETDKNFLIQENDYINLKKLYTKKIKDTIEIKPNIFYTISNLCPKNNKKGYFLIGPYTNNKDFKLVVYKPIYLKKLILKNLRLIWHDLLKSTPNLKNQVSNPHVKKSIDYIYKNFNKDLNLDIVSKHLNINKSYFCSIFKNDTNYTFTQYLNLIRIEKSKKLLLNKSFPLEEIALTVGFSSQNYFNIVFKKLTGMTPLQFRNKPILDC